MNNEEFLKLEQDKLKILKNTKFLLKIIYSVDHSNEEAVDFLINFEGIESRKDLNLPLFLTTNEILIETIENHAIQYSNIVQRQLMLIVENNRSLE